jgi:hypothetical protein
LIKRKSIRGRDFYLRHQFQSDSADLSSYSIYKEDITRDEEHWRVIWTTRLHPVSRVKGFCCEQPLQWLGI